MESWQRPALEFDMPTEDFDPNFTPQDGIQYLQQVAYERYHCPSVVVKPLKANASCAAVEKIVNWNRFETQNIIDTSPKELRSTAEWRKIQIDEFTELRKRIVLIRDQFNRNQTEELIELPDIEDQNGWLLFSRENQPLLSTMLRVDQRGLEILMEYQFEWLNGVDSDHLPVSMNWLCKWMYAGLGCFHVPLEPSMHSILREVAKTCIIIRNSLSPDKVDEAAPLNLLICIISSYFNQVDLADVL